MPDGDLILLGKLGIGIGCAIAAAVLVGSSRPQQLTRRYFDAGAFMLLIVSRLALFVGVYVVLGKNVTSDVGNYYYFEARAALAGELVYRDIATVYAPLFPYVLAGPIALWDSAKAVVLTAIILEAFSFPLWLAAARRWLRESTVRTSTLLYVTSPIPLVNVALNGQNQIWHALLLAGALVLLRRRDTISGLVDGLSLAAVKMVGILFAPAIWLFSTGRVRWLMAFAAPAIIVYAACFMVLGLTWEELTFPLRRQTGHATAGNLPFLTTVFGADPFSAAYRTTMMFLVAAALVAVFLASWIRGVTRHAGNVMHLLTLILLTTLLLGKNSYPSYLVLCFFPLCVTYAAGPAGSSMRLRAILWFGVFGIVAVLEPSLLFRWIKRDGVGDLGLLFMDDLSAGRTRGRVVMFLLCELTLLTAYIGIWWRAWRAMRA